MPNYMIELRIQNKKDWLAEDYFKKVFNSKCFTLCINTTLSMPFVYSSVIEFVC